MAWEWARAVWAAVAQRCPRCRQGKMFRKLLVPNDPCPVCGLIFQREEGYFLGAMYVSTLLGYSLVVPFYFVLEAWFPQVDSIVLALTVSLLYLPFCPLVWRYSRVFWVHLAYAYGPIDPTPYERYRERLAADHPPPDDHPPGEP